MTLWWNYYFSLFNIINVLYGVLPSCQSASVPSGKASWTLLVYALWSCSELTLIYSTYTSVMKLNRCLESRQSLLRWGSVCVRLSAETDETPPVTWVNLNYWQHCMRAPLSVSQQLLLIILPNLLTSSNWLSQEIGQFDDNDGAVGGFNHKIGHRCIIGERCNHNTMICWCS